MFHRVAAPTLKACHPLILSLDRGTLKSTWKSSEMCCGAAVCRDLNVISSLLVYKGGGPLLNGHT